mgnify:CR=1 FL=1
MNKQACYWEKIGDPNYERPWKSECGEGAWAVGRWNYCPFCGKTIYIREKITHNMRGVMVSQLSR